MRGKLSHPAVNITSFLNYLFLGLLFSAILSGCATPASEAIKRGDDMLNIKNYYDASREYLAALNFEPKNNEAKAKLCQIVKYGYEQKLEMAVSYEKASNFEAALSQYQDLATFIDQVTSNNCLSFTAVNAKQKIAEMKSGASEQFYKDAEKLFAAADFTKAISKYQDALRHNNPYKDSKEKIAESHYQIGSKFESQKSYRDAANSFLSANEAVPGYKDASQKAVAIYYTLGTAFLKQKHCRNAYEDLSRASRLNNSFKDINKKLAEAEACSVKKIAFMRFDNTTGRDISGMSMGDYIFDDIKTKLHGKASQFIRTMDREELQAVMSEQKLGLAGVTDEYSTFKQLKGVDYLIFGKLTQVKMDTSPEKVERIRTPTRQEYTCYKTDKKGRQYEATCHRDETLHYERISAKLNVALAGSIKVVSVSSGEQIIMHNISAKRSDEITYANIISNIDNGTDIPGEVEKLQNARRDLKDSDSLVKDITTEIADALVQQILAKLDQAKSVPDPSGLKIVKN